MTCVGREGTGRKVSTVRESAVMEEMAPGVPPHGVGRPEQETRVISDARASNVPKISGNLPRVDIVPRYTRGREGVRRLAPWRGEVAG